MINTAPIFPIVNDGGAPMMPVYAADVAVGVAATLRRPVTFGKTYDLVGPDRLTLRDVVRRVAEALGRPLAIVPTPVGLMRLPVAVMERTMKQPLSTRAQLAMLVEGLAGRLGEAEQQLVDGLAQLRMAFVQINAAAKAGTPGQEESAQQ